MHKGLHRLPKYGADVLFVRYEDGCCVTRLYDGAWLYTPLGERRTAVVPDSIEAIEMAMDLPKLDPWWVFDN